MEIHMCKSQYQLRRIGRSAFLMSTAATVAIVGLTVEPAKAQTRAPSYAIEEVITTARRREESVQDIPVSVSAFSGADVQRNMFKGVDDYLARAPGVSFISTGARDRKDITIRGVSNLLSDNSSARASSFGFYIDEFDVSAGTTNPQVMDIERIEVLRGPQGTYFGRNSIGGAINITTKKPDATDYYAEGTLDVSRYDTYGIEGIVNVPIIQDQLAIRLNAKYEESDGNIKNINPLGGGNESEYKYGKASLRYTPNDRLTVDLSANYTKEDVGMREGVPSGVFAAFSAGLFAGIIGPGVTPDPDGVGFYPENRNRVNFNRPQDVGRTFYSMTGRVNYDFDAFSLTSVTGYIKSKQRLLGDIDGSSVDYFYETNPINRDSLSEELRLQSTGVNRVDWTIGGIISEETGDKDQHTYIGAASPFGLPEGFEITSGFGVQSTKIKSQALFGEVVWHATDRLDVTAGVRYTHEKVALTAFERVQGTIVGTVEADESFNNLSPKLSVNYSVSDDLMTYASVSRGFKTGGVQIGASALLNPSYAPEKLWNYELGFKSTLLDNRMIFNASAFYMDWTDLQTAFNEGVLQDGTLIFISGIQNATSASSYGLEAQVSGLITENFRVNGGVGYVKAEFGSFENAFVEQATYDLTNRTLPNSPKWTLSADAEYTIPVSDTYEAFTRVEWFYRGSAEPDLASIVNEGFPWDVPSFHHTNLRVGIESERLLVTGYVENLFNEKYYTNAYEKVFIGGVHLEPSKRIYGISLKIRTN